MLPLKTVQRDDVVISHPTENINLEVRVADDTVWLTQAQMAVLFGTQRQAITKHLQHIFEEQELEKKSTSSILEQVQKEGKRIVRRCVEFYNLDVIISVGFRVNTQKGIEFRKWANIEVGSGVYTRRSMRIYVLAYAYIRFVSCLYRRWLVGIRDLTPTPTTLRVSK